MGSSILPQKGEFGKEWWWLEVHQAQAITSLETVEMKPSLKELILAYAAHMLSLDYTDLLSRGGGQGPSGPLVAAHAVPGIPCPISAPQQNQYGGWKPITSTTLGWELAKKREEPEDRGSDNAKHNPCSYSCEAGEQKKRSWDQIC